MVLYVLNKNQPYSLSIINYENKDYYFCGSIADQLHIFNVNDHGFIGFNNDNYEENLVTYRHYLEENIYKSKIECLYSSKTGTNDKNYFSNLNIRINDSVELEMTQFNFEEEATPLMFSNVKYHSDSYNFVSYSKERGFFQDPNHDTFFVSYGSMKINDEQIDVGLKFLPDNKFFIFRNDNLEDIIFSGNYTNQWTDINLNIEINKIDDTKLLNLKAEFLPKT